MLKANKHTNMAVISINDVIEEVLIAYCKKYLPKKGNNKNLIIFS
jgi:hypothetical protein